MERETFISGYCRQADGSRTVCVEADGNSLISVDCLYENCPYGDACTVHKKIEEFLEN